MNARAWGSALIVCLGLAASPHTGLAQCTSDKDCDDGIFCNDIDLCDLDTGQCVALSSCPPAIDGCVTRNGACDEDLDMCIDVADDSLCDNGHFCDGIESCDIISGDCVAVSSCPPFIDGCLTTVCNEDFDTCLMVPDNDLCPTGQACSLDGDCETPQQIIEDVLAGMLSLNDGQGDDLTRILRRAVLKIKNGQFKAACNLLSAFIDLVNDMVDMGDLTKDQGQNLTLPLQNVMEALDCN